MDVCDFRVFAFEVLSITACRPPIEVAAIGAHDSACVHSFKVFIKAYLLFETGSAVVALVSCYIHLHRVTGEPSRRDE